MAKMIPAKPRDFAKESLEDRIFNSLEQLPNDYYVFHSFKVVTVQNNIIKESETDFVIFNPDKGILCLEAKAGQVKYQNGEWLYSSGKKMAHGGPYNQASRNKYILIDYIYHSNYSPLLKKCKMLHAVWFPSVTNEKLNEDIMPPEGEISITLTKDDLENCLPKIEAIFEKEVPNGVKTVLGEEECANILMKILCPTFDLVPATSMELDLDKQIFHKMLNEQKCILNYLIEQKSAVIQGMAGTGKTLIALEKARRHADAGEKVLFLCYNKFLKEHISRANPHANIDYYTIDGYACRLSDSNTPNYMKAKVVLEEYYLLGNFPYNHVIIDEGQDFGQEEIEENDIVELLASIISDSEDDVHGTFYVFYDSMQLVQGQNIPEYIVNADCKLTLYKNCRNTENIAITSVKPIRNARPKLIDGCIKGNVPRMCFCDDLTSQKEELDKMIDSYEEKGIDDIVILTCKTEETSSIKEYIHAGKYKDKYKFTSCRKYKGLEADAIIIVDVTENVLITDATKLFYVGTSRARLYLGILAQIDKVQCTNIIKTYGIDSISKNPKKQLATELNSFYIRT